MRKLVVNSSKISGSHKLKRLVLSLAFCLSVPILCFGQSRNGLDDFLGEWKGTGVLFGAKAEFYMKWESVLGGTFIQLSFQNKMENRPAFKATAYYKELDALVFEGQWFDSRGVIQSLTSKFENSELVTLWSNPSTEKGKTVYRLVDKETVEVIDFVWKDEQWKKFGNAKYEMVK